MDIADFNARWLKAWTDKDVPRLVAFYTDDCLYKDPQTAAGITGHAALTQYLTGLFGATPPMTTRALRTTPAPLSTMVATATIAWSQASRSRAL